MQLPALINTWRQAPRGARWTTGQCLDAPHISSFLLVHRLTNDAQAAAYNAAGFEIGVHLNTGCANYTGSSLDAFFTDQMGQFTAMYPSLPAQTTHRIHCVAWSDYSTPASVSRAHGIRLETSYYYWPPTWVNNQPGFFTGSGMPMRFADTNGAIMDIYQATTQMTDESGQSYPYTVDTFVRRGVGCRGVLRGVCGEHAHGYRTRAGGGCDLFVGNKPWGADHLGAAALELG